MNRPRARREWIRTLRHAKSSPTGQAIAPVMETMENRLLLSGTASIAGTAYNDLSADGAHQSNEPVLANWQVYLDKNNNGKYDAGDTQTFTDSKGNYSFSNLVAGTYILRENLPSSYIFTGKSSFPYTVKVLNAQKVTGENFYNLQTATATLASDGTLYVNGTNSSDKITVNLDLDSGSINSYKFAIDLNKTHRIVTQGFSGDDTIVEQGDSNIDNSISVSIYGGAGNDNISNFVDQGQGLRSVSDWIDGGVGNDILTSATSANVTMHGGDGNDTFSNPGLDQNNNYLYGDGGNDTFNFNGDVNQYYTGGTGTDTIALNYAPYGGLWTFDLGTDIENVSGSWGDGDLQIVGNNLNNHIDIQSDGNPTTITGAGGDDYVHVATEFSSVSISGGSGNDSLSGAGGRGSYYFDGGDGNDLLTPGTSINHFAGGTGVDAVDYSKQTQDLVVYLDGSQNSGALKAMDEYDADTGEYLNGPQDTFDGTVERVYSGSGNDLIVGNDLDNALFGNAGNDTIISSGGTNALWGGDGNDLLIARNGTADYLNGGNGDDSAIADSNDTLVSVEHNVNASAFVSSNGTLYLLGTNGDDTINLKYDLDYYPANTPNTGTVTVTINGQTTNIDPANVRRWSIQGFNGNDQISVTGYLEDNSSPALPHIFPSTILGGSGNDTITTQLVAASLFGPDVYIDGGNDKDTINAAANGFVTLNGGSGDDFIESSLVDYASEVSINGGDGNDTLGTGSSGGSGFINATLDGGAGNDSFYNDDFDDHTTFIGGSGIDTILLHAYGSNRDGVSLGNDIENVSGSYYGPINIVGNDLDNHIQIFDQDDGIISLVGGAGNDTLDVSGSGNTTYFDGGEGNDYFIPGGIYSTNHFIGGGGTDVVDYSGRTGDLKIYLDGSQKSGLVNGIGYDADIEDQFNGPNDTFDGTVERVYSGSGNDLIVGNDLDNALFGNAGNDTLIAGAGVNALWGGDGNDLLIAKNDLADYLNGGNNDDSAIADSSDTLVSVEHVLNSSTIVAGGTLYIFGTDSADIIHIQYDWEHQDTTNIGSMSVTVNGNTTSIDPALVSRWVMLGLGGDDQLSASGYVVDASPTKTPHIFPATILGGSGNDTIVTHLESDSLGPDLYVDGGNDDDTIGTYFDGFATLNGGSGNDIIVSSMMNGTLLSVLIGGDGNDWLSLGSTGGSGTQYATLNGGAGNDSFQNEDIDDHATYIGGSGIDTIVLSSDFSSNHDPIDLGPDVENVSGTFSNDLTIIGNDLDNHIQIIDDGGVVHLVGGKGNDTLDASGSFATTYFDGGEGNDYFIPGVPYSANHFLGGLGTDIVDYSSRTDDLQIYLDGSKKSGALNSMGYDYDIEDQFTGPNDTFDGTVERVYSGSGNDLIVGNELDNALFGNAGNDTLIGGGGHNALWGGAGNDLLLAKNGLSDYLNGGIGDDTAQANNIDTLMEIEHIS